jgi:hypothetical protein
VCSKRRGVVFARGWGARYFLSLWPLTGPAPGWVASGGVGRVHGRAAA